MERRQYSQALLHQQEIDGNEVRDDMREMRLNKMFRQGTVGSLKRSERCGT